ncbi:hypothetical protein FB45DRAFT_1004597 [Roridomyces roridus]|uniref:Uncharacterized protein n=1 Tax=Roridomyces roridus TaxID=1738132 RepID=A0AAD7FJ78_9AGAR|nr:hypothetical protein FB45DRAFT_1004597 [Roridomyces roridus]
MSLTQVDSHLVITGTPMLVTVAGVILLGPEKLSWYRYRGDVEICDKGITENCGMVTVIHGKCRRENVEQMVAAPPEAKKGKAEEKDGCMQLDQLRVSRRRRDKPGEIRYQAGFHISTLAASQPIESRQDGKRADQRSISARRVAVKAGSSFNAKRVRRNVSDSAGMRGVRGSAGAANPRNDDGGDGEVDDSNCMRWRGAMLGGLSVPLPRSFAIASQLRMFYKNLRNCISQQKGIFQKVLEGGEACHARNPNSQQSARRLGRLAGCSDQTRNGVGDTAGYDEKADELENVERRRVEYNETS